MNMCPVYHITPYVKILVEKRKSDGTSLYELSEKSGYSVDHLMKLECGHRLPSVSMLNAWAETLGFEVTMKLKEEIK